MSRNKEHRGAAFGGAPNGAAASRPSHWVCVLCFSLFYIINIYGYSLDIPYIFHIYIYIYIYFLNMFHICSLMCFLICGVNRRQVLIAKPHLDVFQNVRFSCFIGNCIIFIKVKIFPETSDFVFT